MGPKAGGANRSPRLHQRQLLPQHATAVVAAPVVVSQDHRQRKRQIPQPAGEAKVTIAEVTHKQNGIRPQLLQQPFIRCTPDAVQVSSDRDTKIGQSRCLGCRHPDVSEPR